MSPTRVAAPNPFVIVEGEKGDTLLFRGVAFGKQHPTQRRPCLDEASGTERPVNTGVAVIPVGKKSRMSPFSRLHQPEAQARDIISYFCDVRKPYAELTGRILNSLVHASSDYLESLARASG